MTRYTDHLGYETDLMILALDGHVVRRDGYWVARSPRMPDHAWGNLLVLDEPPDPSDPDAATRWADRFRGEFTSSIRHVALAWAGSRDAAAETAPFIARGYRGVDTVALATTAPRLPDGASDDVAIRRLRTNAEWRAADALVSHLRDGAGLAPRLDAFMSRQLRALRRWCTLGHAAFFGAFHGRTLVAYLGVVVRREDGLARYQFVVTHRGWRRRGICGRLVAEAGAWAMAHQGARRLVIAAERGSSAERIYRAAGFDEVAGGVGAYWRPRRPAPQPAPALDEDDDDDAEDL